jgi:hypothetical protein
MRDVCIAAVVTVARTVRQYSGGVYDLGLHVVWCPKYRRRVLGGRVAVRLRELIETRAAEKGWETGPVRATVDMVLALQGAAIAARSCGFRPPAGKRRRCASPWFRSDSSRA